MGEILFHLDNKKEPLADESVSTFSCWYYELDEFFQALN
jgi:hypothetical protein